MQLVEGPNFDIPCICKNTRPCKIRNSWLRLIRIIRSKNCLNRSIYCRKDVK